MKLVFWTIGIVITLFLVAIFAVPVMFLGDVAMHDMAVRKDKKERIKIALSNYPAHLDSKTKECQAILSGQRALTRQECECLINNSLSLPNKEYRQKFIEEGIVSLSQRDLSPNISKATLTHLFFKGDTRVRYKDIYYADEINTAEKEWYWKNWNRLGSVRIHMANAALPICVSSNKALNRDNVTQSSISFDFLLLLNRVYEAEQARLKR